MRKLTRKGLKNKLDKEWSRIIRMAGKCAKCNKDENLQACHLFSRSNLSTRWTIKNGICLCAKDHLWWAHKNPIEFTEFVKSYLGEYDYEQLRIMAAGIKKWTDEELYNMYEILRGVR